MLISAFIRGPPMCGKSKSDMKVLSRRGDVRGRSRGDVMGRSRGDVSRVEVT